VFKGWTQIQGVNSYIWFTCKSKQKIRISCYAIHKKMNIRNYIFQSDFINQIQYEYLG